MFLYEVSFSSPELFTLTAPRPPAEEYRAAHQGRALSVTADMTEASLSTQTASHCSLIYLFNLMMSLYDFCLTGGVRIDSAKPKEAA